MDSTDLKIISMLKKNARVSASAIAKEVGLAVSSVTERMRRLESQGVILQYTAIVDNSKIEGGITAMIGIKIEHTRYIDKLADVISRDPHSGSIWEGSNLLVVSNVGSGIDNEGMPTSLLWRPSPTPSWRKKPQI